MVGGRLIREDMISVAVVRESSGRLPLFMQREPAAACARMNNDRRDGPLQHFGGRDSNTARFATVETTAEVDGSITGYAMLTRRTNERKPATAYV